LRHCAEIECDVRGLWRGDAHGKGGGSLLPPKHILNSPTKLMKSEGYGAGYDYDHDAPDAFSGQDYFPEALGRQTFYDPPERGFEREIRKRLEYWAKLRKGARRQLRHGLISTQPNADGCELDEG
jgi:replication-associated recombination protein RarA